MTSKLDPQELERLSKAAEQEDDDVRYYGGPTSTHRPARDAYHAALVQLHRTGQLVPAMPSGDVVEAVARAICQAETGGPLGYFPDGYPMRNGGVWDEFMPNQHDEWRQSARSAITTYEAVSGVAKMRDALQTLCAKIDTARDMVPDDEEGVAAKVFCHVLNAAQKDARAALGEKP